MSTTDLVYQSHRAIRVSTLVDIVEQAMREAGGEAAPAPPAAPAAAVLADWGRVGPTFLGLSAYATVFHGRRAAPPLALVVPKEPAERDRAALGVLLDSLDASLDRPDVQLMSRAALNKANLRLVLRPTYRQNDPRLIEEFERDLRALADSLESDTGRQD